MNATQTDWTKARREIRRRYNELRNGELGYCHSSHAASQAIDEWSKAQGVGFGSEGFCDECGRDGITYLNMGDTYDTTVVFTSWNERFFVSCWGDVYERYQKQLGLS